MRNMGGKYSKKDPPRGRRGRRRGRLRRRLRESEGASDGQSKPIYGRGTDPAEELLAAAHRVSGRRRGTRSVRGIRVLSTPNAGGNGAAPETISDAILPGIDQGGGLGGVVQQVQIADLPDGWRRRKGHDRERNGRAGTSGQRPGGASGSERERVRLRVERTILGRVGLAQGEGE